MNGLQMAMVEHGCADCPLRAVSLLPVREPEEDARNADPEQALERQLEQLERSFGANWKW